ncbi:UDP-glucose 4-epimerase family protein [Psychromonas aquimarina]|uniref:UDP-glucose 4-epimerase family protein n=1 Tax=Psychromonas aquimarina TaxID=444919 RepID=UPI0003F53A83|nr:SDR family oxidoreductase [Psychromonas aquimarina]
MEIVLTGISGFVGQALLPNLLSKQYNIRAAVRSLNERLNGQVSQYSIDNICKNQDWERIVINADIVIHCAARVHIMNDASTNPLDEFRAVNTYGTLNLAQQAADAGVKRFIFISSVKVNGESTELGRPFKPDCSFVPTEPYGLSKYEAEIGLRKIADNTGMEVVIIRPPLVYGAGVKANFASMMHWVNKGVPLPLGGIKNNIRSLVSVDNLVDLIVTCIEHPKAANQTFLVSDDNDVSTTGLLEHMAIALDVPSRLLTIPSSWFTFFAKLIGKPAISQRLCGSLQVDISKTKKLLNWQPPYSIAECMKKTAVAFIKNNRK